MDCQPTEFTALSRHRAVFSWELFVITDKENPRACRVYEKAGGKSEYDNEVVYVIDYEKVENGEDGV